MRVKYPSTPYLNMRHGYPLPDHFYGHDIVITEKMDGENTTLYSDGYLHARSIDSPSHPSQSWLRQWLSGISYTIPKGARVCGENLYAKHSIAYEKLPSYFMGFSVWSGDQCWNFTSTLNLFHHLGIHPVPILYEGMCTENILEDIIDGLDLTKSEGIVVRLRDGFSMDAFDQCVAKWVRPNHVQTDDYWKHQPIIPNGLG